MRKKWMERFKRDRDPLDGHRKTSKRKESSNNSSSPTPTLPSSTHESSNGSKPTLFVPGVNLSTQSTSSATAFVSSAPSPQPDPEFEGEFEAEYTVVIKSYGRYSKMEDTINRYLSLALYRTFRDTYVLKDEAGRRIIFDHLAHDGEHRDRDVVIIRQPNN